LAIVWNRGEVEPRFVIPAHAGIQASLLVEPNPDTNALACMTNCYIVRLKLSDVFDRATSTIAVRGPEFVWIPAKSMRE
jgi:hypothetical protein